jgi:type I restriction enzyme S subunit
MLQNRVPIGKYITEYSIRNKNNEDIPVYSVTNSQGFCTEYFDKEVASKDKTTYKIVPKGYFAYNPSRINVGSVDWQKSEEKVIVSPLYNVFSVSEELDQQYLFYFLKSDIGRQMIKAKASGSVRDNLKMDMLKEITIPERTLQEQKKCVAVLDKVKNIITLQETRIEKYDVLTRARFVELFGDTVTNPLGWEEHRLDEYIDFLTSGSRGWARYFVKKENELFITIKNVKNNHITLDDIQYVDAPNNKEAERTKVKAGDLLISITADLGRTGVVDIDIAEKGAYINQHLSLVRLNKERINPLYVSYFLETEGGKRQFASKNQNGVKAGLNFDAIKSLKILVPPRDKQEVYLDFVAQVDKSKLINTNIIPEGGGYNGNKFHIS